MAVENILNLSALHTLTLLSMVFNHHAVFSPLGEMGPVQILCEPLPWTVRMPCLEKCTREIFGPVLNIGAMRPVYLTIISHL